MFPRQTIQYHSNPSLCPNHYAEEGEFEWFYEDLQDLLELNQKKKKVLFITGDWNAKVGSQEIPGVIGKFGFGVQNEAEQRLTEFCQENSLVIANTLLPTTQEMTLHMDITRWSIPKSDGLYSLLLKMEKLHTDSTKKDQELTVAQIMNSFLQKTGLN